MNFILLYLEFFLIGVFAVGGGLATLPFLFLMANDRFMLIQQSSWLSIEQVGSFIAIAQCSPGAIGVNVAAQAGFQYGGIGGSFLAVLGLVSPAVIAISFITKALQSIRNNNIATSVFSGLRPAATGLLSAAAWGVWRLALYDPQGAVWHEIIRWRESLVCLALFLLVMKFKGHPVIYVALGAIAGIVFGL